MKKKIHIIILFFLTFFMLGCDNVGVKLYYNFGYWNHQTGDLQDAIEYYEKVIEIDSTYTKAYISMGSAYLDLELFNKAIESYESALILSPANATIIAYMGRAFYDKNDNKTALKYFEKAIKLDQSLGYAYYNRGLILYTSFQYAKGCKDLKKALALGYYEAQELLDEAHCEDYE